MAQEITRRDLIKSSALAVSALPLVRFGAAGMSLQAPSSRAWLAGLKPGVASYTLRKLPLDQADQGNSEGWVEVRFDQGFPSAA